MELDFGFGSVPRGITGFGFPPSGFGLVLFFGRTPFRLWALCFFGRAPFGLGIFLPVWRVPSLRGRRRGNENLVLSDLLHFASLFFRRMLLFGFLPHSWGLAFGLFGCFLLQVQQLVLLSLQVVQHL